MPVCAKGPRPARPIWLLLALLLAACGGVEQGARFSLNEVEAEWTNGQLKVTAEQSLALSAEARNALVHGVPLIIETTLSLRESGKRTPVADYSERYEIRYLPLSDRYRLTGSNHADMQTFPRLRHVLAALSTTELSVRTGAVPAGDYELLIRTRLDLMRMPPPMRLPVHMSAEWRHDSRWTSWPLEIEPGA
jgi:hypothetical protein